MIQQKYCLEWVKRDSKVIAPCQHLSYFPLVVDKGMQDIVIDVDGNRFIDFLSSASSLNLGNNNPILLDAINKQLNKCVQYSPAYTYNELMIEYAERLVSVYPGGEKAKVWFGNSGSDANDAAIKFARAFTGRKKIITFLNSYHGSTYGSASLSACSIKMHEKMGPFLSDIFHFPFIEETAPKEKLPNCCQEIEIAFNTYLPPQEVAAIIIEPMQGDGGMKMASKDFIQQLFNICKKYSILFIVDEVQQAFFRNKHWFSIENFDIIPDGIVLGKSIGGGLPLSAFMAKESIMNILPPIAHTFTLGGNHLACAAGIAEFDFLSSEVFQSILKNNMKLIEELIDQLRSKNYDIVSFICGSGMSFGISIVDKIYKKNNIINTIKIVYRCYEYGLLIISVSGNVLRIQPPLNISSENLKEGFRILDLAIQDVQNDMVPDNILEYYRGW